MFRSSLLVTFFGRSPKNTWNLLGLWRNEPLLALLRLAFCEIDWPLNAFLSFLKQDLSDNCIVEILQRVQVPEFIPKSKVRLKLSFAFPELSKGISLVFRFLLPKNLVVGESWPPWFIFVIFPCWFQQIETDETASKSAETSSFDVDKLILYLKETIAEGLKSSEGMAFISFACQKILWPVSLHHLLAFKRLNFLR